MEYLVLALFCIVLIVCVILKISLILALGIGLVLFFCYALHKGFSFQETAKMCIDGMLTAKNVLITFLIIGILTGMWRSAGTIPTIICYSSRLFVPSLFLTITFLLNCMVSILTGTSFGTAATMGVICAAVGSAMQMSPMLTGGAVLAGAFFGDRCSPVSTSALLVSELTHTDIYTNIKGMIKCAVVPFVLSCLIYTGLGFLFQKGEITLEINELFQKEFVISWIALIPAAVVLALSLFHIKVKKTMLVSIAFAIPISLFIQGNSPAAVLHDAVFGYAAKTPELVSMISGGGLKSMVNVTFFVCLSAAYSGVFKKTGLLLSIQEMFAKFSNAVSPYGATLLASILSGFISCNQTLTIMLTDQLCSDLQPDKEKFALYLENSAVVMPPLIPWSIAGAVPLASVGAPTSGILAACFLYLLPICQLVESIHQKKS